MNMLRLYKIDMKYIRCLQNKDKRVYSVNPQKGKQNRPFLGVFVLFDNQQYCIPLSSAKAKYQHMSDKIDFTRIVINGEIIAGINFSRMIPVDRRQLKEIDLIIRNHDNKEARERKALLKMEIDWCNENKDLIIGKAKQLYEKYTSGEFFKRRYDCLNFPEMEKICKRYNTHTI